MIRILVLAAVLLVPAFALAQSLAEQTQALQSALQNNQTDKALNIATDLYARSDAANDHETAGFAAFAEAGLLEQDGDPVAAAKAYARCASHYASLTAEAQSIQCTYKSALAYLDGHQKGRGIDALEQAAKRLEAIGQDKSAFASQVYLTLAEETRPLKYEDTPTARVNRDKAANYADKSMAALSKSGLDQSEYFAAAAFAKGMALEDAKDYEQAEIAYGLAIATYRDLPDASNEYLRNMMDRMAIVRASQQGPDDGDGTLTVKDEAGNTITLTVDKRKHVRFPKINRNQRVDGARASVEMTLDEDGQVDTIRVTDSMPSSDFGDVLERAVKTWTFSPPEGINPADIPPFEYSMIFYLERR